MGVKLKHASGNGTVLGAPAANPSADITLKAPSTTGSAGQVLKVASANHSSTNAELEWAADSSGLFSSYAIITNELSAGTQGGASTANAWTTYELNTELADPSSIVSISSNQFTLAAGNYLVKWRIMLQNGERAISRVYDVTNSAVRQYSTAQYGVYTGQLCPGVARLTPSGSTAYKIEYYADNTDGGAYGKGMDAPDDVAVTINAVVEIYKEV